MSALKPLKIDIVSDVVCPVVLYRQTPHRECLGPGT